MDDRAEPVRRRSRGRTVAAAILLILLLILLGLWLQRKPIAAGFIDRELARRGVPARYEIKQLGFGTQRLEHVVIGDPAHPDLTADWIEVSLALRLGSPKVTLITARGVRLAGRIINGRLSLGSIDRLLPAPSGAPFSLPDLAVDLADTTVRLDTPAGRIGLAVQGRGNLTDGFAGAVAAVAPTLSFGGCAAVRPTAHVALAINGRRPSIKGPVKAANLACRDSFDADGARVVLDTVLGPALDTWLGTAAIGAVRVQSGANVARGLSGQVGFAGNASLTRGALRLAAAGGELASLHSGGLGFDGHYAWSPRGGGLSLRGDARTNGTSAGPASVRPFLQALAGAAGTPVEPLGRTIGDALRRSASGFDAGARIALVNGSASGALRVEQLDAQSRSGAHMALTSGSGFTYYWPSRLTRVDGAFSLAGGGFPALQASLRQSRAGGAIEGVAHLAPFAAGGARLQLGDVRFAAGADGTTRLATIVRLDGPFSGGRVTGLTLPVSGRIGRNGFAFGEGCIAATFSSLRLSSLTLGPARLPLCPIGPALLWKKGKGGVQGGAVIASPRFAGTIGQSPIKLAADRLRFDLADRRFLTSGLAVMLGRPETLTRLDAASLSGRLGSSGLDGAFEGLSGRIGNVPILASAGKGRWSLAAGRLKADGALTVADAADPARFYPLLTDDLRLTLVDNRIDASASLRHPANGTLVGEAIIVHDLASGSGNAVLDVPGIRFTPAFQPEALTPLTTGVVALVDGNVTGRGNIRWNVQGVSSDGAFSTDKMNLAAAFGPVTGLTTTIHFTDLLNLETAPGQRATIGQIQAGIDVFDGELRYQLLSGLRVRVESGRWPFAGGELALEETILDFSKPTAKTLTFRVTGLDAAAFIQQLQFSNISATGTFDGTVPMIFDQAGGRIVDGHLVARDEGGTLSYIGELSDKNLGTYGKLAFDALKALRYSRLTIDLNGALDGEFVAGIRLDGIARESAGVAAPAKGGISGLVVGRALSQLAKIPFRFNIMVKGPFRALMGTARSLEDPSLLIQSVLPERLKDQPATTIVQPQESETVP